MNNVTNSIVCGNCIEILQGKEQIVDLIFADPPFNIGYKYDKYHDVKKKDQYNIWTKDWIQACYDALKPAGSMYIAIGDDHAADIKITAEEIGLHLRNWIIWHYTFGQQAKNKFARSHTHIFYFVKNKKDHTFNDHAVRVPSDRQLIYNDKRANPKGKLPDDTWNEYSRVCGTFKERAGWHPCQMPESLLSRIIAVSSNKGDLVLDPFMGSGTTAAAALKMGRHYFGVDISENYVENAKKRLENIEEEIKSHSNSIFSFEEEFEVKRLCSDMGFMPGQIIGNDKLLSAFTTQLEMRLNAGKKFKIEDVSGLLSKL